MKAEIYELRLTFSWQCSAARIKADMERASREGWKWGAKAVRGAYIHQERALAEEHGHESPIHDTLADTHDNYDRCLLLIMAPSSIPTHAIGFSSFFKPCPVHDIEASVEMKYWYLLVKINSSPVRLQICQPLREIERKYSYQEWPSLQPNIG